MTTIRRDRVVSPRNDRPRAVPPPPLSGFPGNSQALNPATRKRQTNWSCLPRNFGPNYTPIPSQYVPVIFVK